MSVLLRPEKGDLVRLGEDELLIEDAAQRYIDAHDNFYNELDKVRVKWRSESLQDEIDKIREILK